MKKLYSLITLVVAVSFAANAQTSMTINLDVSKMLNPDCNLNGGVVADDKVYMHAGLCTSDEIHCLSQIGPLDSDVWEHVVGNWGDDPQDDGVGLMDYLGGTEWTKTIVVEEYFSSTDVNPDESLVGPMPAGATPYTIGLVFRDKDDSYSGRDNGCSDIFIVKIQTDPTVYQGTDSQPWDDSPITFAITSSVPEYKNVVEAGVYPNPAQDQVLVSYYMKKEVQDLSVTVVNSVGKEVMELFSGSHQQGRHQIKWDTKDASGNQLENGMYFIRIQTPNSLHTEKLILMN